MAKRNSKKTIESNEPIQLNLATLADHKKDIDELETVSLANGKFKFTINKTFRATVIDEKLIPDVRAAILILKKENIDIKDLSDTLLILNMCILKHFTNLGLNHLDMSKEPDVRKIIAVAREFHDKDIFKEIIQSIPKSEKTKVEEQIEAFNVIQGQINEMFVSIALAEQEKINAEQETLESEIYERDESESIAEDVGSEDK